MNKKFSDCLFLIITLSLAITDAGAPKGKKPKSVHFCNELQVKNIKGDDTAQTIPEVEEIQMKCLVNGLF